MKAKLRPKWRYPLGHVDVGLSEYAEISSVLASGWLSPGEKVAEFEKQFAQAHESRHALFVNSGTDALRIALATLKEVHGWQDGDEVIVPALTFVATVNVILQNGLKPVFVDVDPVDFNLDFTQIAAARTPRTRCIIPVHLFGRMADMYQIMPECSGLKVIEDSCETMGTRWIDGRENGNAGSDRRNGMVGSFGDIACFSTYACHLLVTGVGGIALTKNSQYDRIMRSFANHGRDPMYLGGGLFEAGAPDPLETMRSRFLFHRVGYSSRVSELEAAVGLCQLSKLPDSIKARARNARVLSERLSPIAFNGVDGLLQLPPVLPINRQHAFMMYPIVIKDPIIDRDSMCLELERAGIETRPLMPLLTQPVYMKLFGNISSNYPVAHEAGANGFYIGCHQGFSDRDLAFIARTIKDVCVSMAGDYAAV